MKLTPGEAVGRYEIVATIGAGAMGEVYRARDPELQREVAIKVLPTELTSDPSRRERFGREARAVARLDHPNLLAIHDLGRHHGAPYIVCELLEGETLRERLDGGPVSVAEALNYAVQLADGLAAAHDQGVVHRDLKPANVFVTENGRIKILDFGLAKLTAPDLMADSVAATMEAVTESGALVGTVAYMAPEQAAGGDVDHRTDQFAFGVVLYEMLTGRRPFEADTAPEILTAILREDPPPLSRTAADVPAPLRWTVERCLERDPDSRYQSTRDLHLDVRAIRQRLSEIVAPEDGPVVEGRRRRLSTPVAAGIVAAILVAAALLAYLGGRNSVETPDLDYERMTFRRGTVTGARFDPGGEGVLYSATWDGDPGRLYLHPAGSLEPLTVGPNDTELLDVSEQGDALLLTDLSPLGPFLRAGTLVRMPVSGAPRHLQEGVVAADLGPDGELGVLVREVGSDLVVEFPPGTARHTTRGNVLDLRLSPDGRRVAFVETPGRGRDRGPITILDREGSETRVSHDGGGGLAWTPSGEELWFTAPQESVLYAVDLSGRIRRIASFPTDVSVHDIAPDGEVLLGVEEWRFEIAGRTGSGDAQRLTWLAWSVPFDISSDGRTILFNECSHTLPVCRVAIRGFDDDPPTDLGEGFGMSLSPDGAWVLSVPPWSPRELALIATGSAQRRTIEVEGIEGIASARWAADGKSLLLNASRPGEANRIFRLDLDGGTPQALTPDGIEFGFFAESPDGGTIAAPLAAGGIGVYPIAGGESTHHDLDAQPIQWSDDGRTLFTVPIGAVPATLRRLDVSSGGHELVASLLPADPAGVVQVSPVAITPDGSTWVYGYVRRLSDLFVVEGLR